jgi:hypothetical protein
MGCRDQPADVPCDDGDPLTVADHCDGGGECVGDPTTTTTAMVTTTTMTTSTTASTSTTSTTLAQNCGCVPVGCDVDQCAVPKLHRKAKRIARAIKRRCEHGRQPTARIERLTALLTKCAGAS